MPPPTEADSVVIAAYVCRHAARQSAPIGRRLLTHADESRRCRQADARTRTPRGPGDGRKNRGFAGLQSATAPADGICIRVQRVGAARYSAALAKSGVGRW